MFELKKRRPRLSVTQAAKYLEVSREYVYQCVRKNRIKHHKENGIIYIYKDECYLPPPLKAGRKPIFKKSPAKPKKRKKEKRVLIKGVRRKPPTPNKRLLRKKAPEANRLDIPQRPLNAKNIIESMKNAAAKKANSRTSDESSL